MFLKRFPNLRGCFDEGMTVFCVPSFKAECIKCKEKKCYGDLRSISLNSVLLCNWLWNFFYSPLAVDSEKKILQGDIFCSTS